MPSLGNGPARKGLDHAPHFSALDARGGWEAMIATAAAAAPIYRRPKARHRQLGGALKLGEHCSTALPRIRRPSEMRPRPATAAQPRRQSCTPMQCSSKHELHACARWRPPAGGAPLPGRFSCLSARRTLPCRAAAPAPPGPGLRGQKRRRRCGGGGKGASDGRRAGGVRKGRAAEVGDARHTP